MIVQSMSRRLRRVPYWLPGVAACAILTGYALAEERSDQQSQLSDLLSADDTAGFALAIEPREFEFPRDHGPHPAFRNEWWYMTGNLDAADGRRFGFELTIFRFTLAAEK